MKCLIAGLALLTLATSGCSARDPGAAPANETAAQVDGVLSQTAKAFIEAKNEGSKDHPEASLYDASINAGQAMDSALAQAKAEGKLVIVAMGANWCHDSRAFAGWMIAPRFKKLIADHYVLIFVNVGRPQTKDGHNLDIAKRYGIEIEGTPTVLILSPDGKLLNADTAKNWRDTASRSENDIFDELQGFTTN
ncbi:MAG: thioredoxin family protein [Pontixanthobacter sp.]